MSELSVARNLKLFESYGNYGVSTRTREVETARTFFGQEGSRKLLRFCADVFYGRPPTIVI